MYIGNLYYDLKEEDIGNAFLPFRLIHSIDMSLEPGTSRDEARIFRPRDASARFSRGPARCTTANETSTPC
ncbi:hypothetical protein PsorP6_009575 [Peronosclerospora sorghi]|uniref:Uncharacterized protein n=1 Tax=Peronosclerospora sorghi TaxID=230839 RepID=A0ACC0VZU0_9STRA|nr:hypothetical protein PsorP6_009575 [Peronosclerospora sorghi]